LFTYNCTAQLSPDFFEWHTVLIVKKTKKTLPVRTVLEENTHPLNILADTSLRGSYGLPHLEMVSSLLGNRPERTQKLTKFNIEMNMCIIVGCLSTLLPLFKGRSRTQNNSGPYTNYPYSHRSEGMKIIKSNRIEVQWSDRSLTADSSVKGPWEHV